MWETDRNSGTTREPASIPDFVDYRQTSRQVDRVGAFVSFDVNLVPDGGEPRRLSVLGATPELAQLLGVALSPAGCSPPTKIGLAARPSP